METRCRSQWVGGWGLGSGVWEGPEVSYYSSPVRGSAACAQAVWILMQITILLKKIACLPYHVVPVGG